MSKSKQQVLAKFGGRGASVSLVRRSDRSGLWLRWWDPTLGARGNWVLRVLDHEDLERAKAECAKLAYLRVAKVEAESKPGEISITQLFAAYEEGPVARKEEEANARGDRYSGSQAWYDRHRMKLWQEHLADPARLATSIDAEAVEKYISWRRAQQVGETTIGHEIVFLKGVMNWATGRLTESGEPLLRMNPIAKVKRISTPHDEVDAPVADETEFAMIYRHADKADRQMLLRPLLMLVHEHGWRVGALLKLRASDVDIKPYQASRSVLWPYGRIRKRKANDKKGKGDWVPMTPRSQRAARLLLKRAAAIGEGWLFRAPVAQGPWQYQHAHDLLERAENLLIERLRERKLLGEEEQIRLGGYHALRRKWASDRKEEPLPDVAAAGHWHPLTLAQHYLKADAATTLRVVLGGKR